MPEKAFRRYTLTAALPYANGPVHIGHLAGVYIPADIYARYRRLRGDDVLFVCGSDEHGVPVTIRARKEGLTPPQVVEKYHTLIRDAFADFGISFDVYDRTSSPIHHQTSSDFFRKLYDQGDFVEQVSEQFYDATAGQFLADRYIQGTCPSCGYADAYGDQCENCGTTLSPAELINPRSMLSGATPERRETKHWYLPLDQHEDWLRQWILEGHTEWKTNVYGQCKGWIDQGLQPRAVTRDLDWGVPVPVAGAEGKVLYVWFDAPIGYISATRAWAEQHGRDWRPYWQSPDTRLLHFIGKDNIVFHCIIFPTMLRLHGDYILPDNVPANEFLTLEGQKISTSRNWAVWLHEYLRDFPGQQDVLRYLLCANAPETKDNDFTWKDFQAHNNGELVAVLGNFVHRAMVLTHKYFEGKVPPPGAHYGLEEEAIARLQALPDRIAHSLEHFRFREAQDTMMEVARLGNKYLADTEPWKLYKTEPERVGTVLHLGLQIVANLAVLAEPFLPFTAARLRQMLRLDAQPWSAAGRTDLLPVGHQLGTPEMLFTKIEDDVIAAQVQRLLDIKAENERSAQALAPLKAHVTYEHFAKLDLRVATIVAAEVVPKTKKLLQLTLQTGSEQRTVVSGIAEFYAPETVIGQQVCLLANLAPRKIKGIVSEGMILMAEDEGGRLVFVSPAQAVRNGSEVS